MPRQVTLRTVQVSRLAQTLIHNRTSANINLLPSFFFSLFKNSFNIQRTCHRKIQSVYHMFSINKANKRKLTVF